MKLALTGTALFLALLATVAFAASSDQEVTNAQTGKAQTRGAEGQHDRSDAHGYQNPAGKNPQPRLNEDSMENAHETDGIELDDDKVNPHQQ